MKKILLTLLLGAATSYAQIPAPQIPLTGNIGSAGIFPLFNSSTLVFSSDANHTMVYPETSAFFIRVTSAVPLTATRNLIAPLTLGFDFTIDNATTGGQSIQIIGSSGTGVTIANGTTVRVVSDGTNYVSVGISGGGGTGCSVGGTLGNIFYANGSGGCANSANLAFNTTTFALTSVGTITSGGNFANSTNPLWGGSSYLGSEFSNAEYRTAQTLWNSGSYGAGIPQVHGVDENPTFSGLGHLWRYSMQTKGASTQLGRNIEYTSRTAGQSIAQSGSLYFLGDGDQIQRDLYEYFGGNGGQENAENSHGDWRFLQSVPSGSGHSLNCLGGCALTNTTQIIWGDTQRTGQGTVLFDVSDKQSGTITGYVAGTAGAPFQGVTVSGFTLTASKLVQIADAIQVDQATATSAGFPTSVTVSIATSPYYAGALTSTATLPSSGVMCLANPPRWTGLSNEGDDLEEWEAVPYTVVDATHISVKAAKIHSTNSLGAVGGACQYGIEQHAQTDIQGAETVYPVIYSDASNHLFYEGGNLNGAILGRPGYRNFQSSGGDTAAYLYPIAEVLAPQVTDHPESPNWSITTPFTFPTNSAVVARSLPFYSQFNGDYLQLYPNEDTWLGGYVQQLHLAGGAGRRDNQTGSPSGGLYISNDEPTGNFKAFGGNYNPPDYAIGVNGQFQQGVYFSTPTWGMFFDHNQLPSGATSYQFCPYNSNPAVNECATVRISDNFSTNVAQADDFQFQNRSGGGKTFEIQVSNGAQTAQTISYGAFNLSGTASPLLLNGSAGTSGQCPISGGAGVTPSWGSCGSGSSGISGLTAGYVPLAGSATTLTGNAHLDDGITTPSTLTASEPIAINASGKASQVALTYNSTAPTVGSSATAVYAVNSSGQAVIADGGGSFNRPCTAANGLCSGSGIANTTVTTATTSVPAASSGVYGCDASATTVTITGATTSMVVNFTPTADASGVTGWNSGVFIDAWISAANTLSYKRCNTSTSAQSPGAMTWNVGVR